MNVSLPREIGRTTGPTELKFAPEVEFDVRKCRVKFHVDGIGTDFQQKYISFTFVVRKHKFSTAHKDHYSKTCFSSETYCATLLSNKNRGNREKLGQRILVNFYSKPPQISI